MDGVLAMFLTDLGFADEAAGCYYLGKQAMRKKEFDVAETALRARAGAPSPDSWMRATARRSTGPTAARVEEAVALGRQLAEDAPDYAPVFLNLAYWYAVDLEQPEEARPYFERAKALGIETPRKLDKAMGED